MATVNVSTWTELANAIQASYGDASITINLTADIDCNNEIPLGVESTIKTPSELWDRVYTINGNHHVIRNLRTHITSPVKIFGFSIFRGNVYWNDVDFINLVLDDVLMGSSDDTTVDIHFTNCRFVGRRTNYLFRGGSENYVGYYFTSCFFNVFYIPANSSTNDEMNSLLTTWKTNGYANFCWFRESYNGWAVPNDNDTYTTTSTYNIQLTGCYIDGEIVTGSYGRFMVTREYNANVTIQNVVDVNFKCKNRDVSATTGAIRAPKGVYRNYFTKYGDDSVVYDAQYITNAGTYAIPESPTDMTNPAKMYADGFDIIVPE